MSKYYTGQHARNYNKRWHILSERSHTAVLATIDIAALHSSLEKLGRQPRVLDIACGTGLLLKKLFDLVPNLDIYGIDASIDMLRQANIILKGAPNIHLQHTKIGTKKAITSLYSPYSFDVIVCTNALHYLPDLVTLLVDLRELLAPGGCIVIQDYILPQPPFPGRIFEWITQTSKQEHISEYTLAEAQLVCKLAGFSIVCSKQFIIDKVIPFFPTRNVDSLWQGWILQLISSQRRGGKSTQN